MFIDKKLKIQNPGRTADCPGTIIKDQRFFLIINYPEADFFTYIFETDHL